MAERKNLRVSVVAGRDASPVLRPTEHDLDPVASLVSTPVVFNGDLAHLAVRYTGSYPLVLQGFSEPVGIVIPISEQPPRGGLVTQKGRRAGVVADLTRRHEEPDRAAACVGQSVQLGVHPDLSSTNQAPASPFLLRRFEAVRCAFR